MNTDVPEQPVDTTVAGLTTGCCACSPPEADRRALTKSTIEELVTRTGVGERQAVAELVNRIRPVVVRYCRLRLGATEHGSFEEAVPRQLHFTTGGLQTSTR